MSSFLAWTLAQRQAIQSEMRYMLARIRQATDPRARMSAASFKISFIAKTSKLLLHRVSRV